MEMDEEIASGMEPEQLDEMPEEVQTTEYIPRPRAEETVRWQLTIFDLIEGLRHRLAGEVYDDIKEEWVPAGKKLMNEDGIRSIISIVEFHVNKSMILSNFEKKEIARMMERIHQAIASLFAYKWKEFEMEKEYLDIIIECVTNFIWGGLKRAELGAEKKFLSQTQRITERIVQRQEEKKGGFLASLGLGGD